MYRDTSYPARILTPNDETPIVAHEGGLHNHTPDPIKVEVRKLRRRVVNEALSTQSSAQAIAANAFSEVPNVVLANMPTLNSIQRTFRRQTKQRSGTCFAS